MNVVERLLSPASSIAWTASPYLTIAEIINRVPKVPSLPLVQLQRLSKPIQKRTMPSYTAATLILLLATACNAQFSSDNIVADLILTEQSAVNSSIECRSYYEDVPSATIGMRIAGDYIPGSCYNIGETFSLIPYGNNTNEFRGNIDSCWPLNEDCNNTYQALSLNNYRPEANFSHVGVILQYRDTWTDFNQFMLTVFAGDACEDNAPQPWFSWGGCNVTQAEYASCRELPYSVKSFRLERTNNSAQCMVAAERGAGVIASKTSLVAVVGGVVVAGLMVVVW